MDVRSAGMMIMERIAVAVKPEVVLVLLQDIADLNGAPDNPDIEPSIAYYGCNNAKGGGVGLFDRSPLVIHHKVADKDILPAQ